MKVFFDYIFKQRRPITAILALSVIAGMALQGHAEKFRIRAKVRDGITKVDITDARYNLFTQGDTLVAEGVTSTSYRTGSEINYVETTMPEFNTPYVGTDRKYLLEILRDNYEPLYTEIDPSKKNPKLDYIDLGYLEIIKVRKLDDVVVTATKIKFYNKGDTLIYNADAFRLAEGSMLDALISQLPGVELKDNGEILVNGRKIESLMLNSKDFFKGNNNVMLQNLGAYTVKNIAVYDRQNEMDALLGENYGEKTLTMDVRLKKEYSQGWMLNAEAGYGIKDKFLGRLFAMNFSDVGRIGIYGNANNIAYTWKPDARSSSSMPSDLSNAVTVYNGGLDYNYQQPGAPVSFEGNVDVQYEDRKLDQTANITNFLPDVPDTYEYTFSDNHSKELNIFTSHTMKMIREKWNFLINPKFRYIHNKDISKYLSGTFTREWDDVDYDFINSIYSNNSQGVLASLINRNRQDRETRGHSNWYNIWSQGKRKINETDAIGYLVSYTGNRSHSDIYSIYLLNEQADVRPTVSDLRHFKNYPDHDWRIKGNLNYTWVASRQFNIEVSYIYQRFHRKSTSELYRQQNYLEDNADNLAALMPSAFRNFGPLDIDNSYHSFYREEQHDLDFNIGLDINNASGNIKIPLTVRRQWQHYMRGSVNSKLHRNNFFVGDIRANFNINIPWQKRVWIYLYFERKVTSPDMVDMVNFENSLDPLNIRLGNPNLKDADSEELRAMWQQYVNGRRNMSYSFGFTGTLYRNTLAYGYDYDRETGVRTGRMYNIMGNAKYAVYNTFNSDFGRNNCFTIRNLIDLNYDRNADLYSVGSSKPEKNIVNRYAVRDVMRLTYNYKILRLGATADLIWNRYKSQMAGFEDFSAANFRYGINANIDLPANFAINTDFSIYNRRGYTDSRLNTTNYVWNARLSYSMLKGNLLFMLDGFDILHNLKNISYSVNAQARTETTTNVIPRYIMLHVQYRFNKQPRK